MQQDRGREAEAPITARGWADILYRVWKDTGKKNLSLVAGGVTYYLLLALFPALAALVSVYGLVADPADMAKSVQSLSGMLPPSTVMLIGDELHQLVSASSKSLGLGAVIGIVIAIWSSVRGMTGMMTALNIAYAQPERRGFMRFNATALVPDFWFPRITKFPAELPVVQATKLELAADRRIEHVNVGFTCNPIHQRHALRNVSNTAGEICDRQGRLRYVAQRIEWAQSQRPLRVLDRHVVFVMQSTNQCAEAVC